MKIFVKKLLMSFLIKLSFIFALNEVKPYTKVVSLCDARIWIISLSLPLPHPLFSGWTSIFASNSKLSLLLPLPLSIFLSFFLGNIFSIRKFFSFFSLSFFHLGRFLNFSQFESYSPSNSSKTQGRGKFHNLFKSQPLSLSLWSRLMIRGGPRKWVN